MVLCPVLYRICYIYCHVHHHCHHHLGVLLLVWLTCIDASLWAGYMLTMFVCRCQLCLGTGVKANMVNWYFLPETKTAAAAAAATIAFCLSALHICNTIVTIMPVTARSTIFLFWMFYCFDPVDQQAVSGRLMQPLYTACIARSQA